MPQQDVFFQQIALKFYVIMCFTERRGVLKTRRLENEVCKNDIDNFYLRLVIQVEKKYVIFPIKNTYRRVKPRTKIWESEIDD